MIHNYTSINKFNQLLLPSLLMMNDNYVQALIFTTVYMFSESFDYLQYAKVQS